MGVTGFDTPMAISNYLGVLIIVLLMYPFVIVGISMAVFEEVRRKKYISGFHIIWFTVAISLFVMHLQTEVIYGKELLDSLGKSN